MSDFGGFPGGRIEEFRDRIRIARRKFDRLDAFSGDQLEAELAGDDSEAMRLQNSSNIAWDTERKDHLKVFDRLSRDTFAVIRDLMKLIHLVRDDRTLLEIYSIEHSTQAETRSKRSKSDIRKLTR
jgi:hypothetical protein